jgi:hypothetical protein
MPEEPVTIFNIANGALGELFDKELQRVLADVLDPNTKATEVRSITIKVAFRPDESREFSAVGLLVTSSLGKPKPIGAQIFFGRKGGQILALENNPKQSGLFDKDKDKEAGKLLTIPSKSEK